MCLGRPRKAALLHPELLIIFLPSKAQFDNPKVPLIDWLSLQFWLNYFKPNNQHNHIFFPLNSVFFHIFSAL